MLSLLESQGAVPALAVFEYDHDLGQNVAAKHHWSLLSGDKYYVSFAAQRACGNPFPMSPAHFLHGGTLSGNEGKAFWCRQTLRPWSGTGLSHGRPALSARRDGLPGSDGGRLVMCVS